MTGKAVRRGRVVLIMERSRILHICRNLVSEILTAVLVMDVLLADVECGFESRGDGLPIVPLNQVLSLF